MAMDAYSAMKEIVAAFRYLHEVHEMAKRIEGKAADMLSRLLVFETRLTSFEKDRQLGRFQAPGQLQALLRLQSAVLAAERLISKHTGTKRGGVVPWVKGAWNAKGNTNDLQQVEARITEAVQDLTFAQQDASNEEILRRLDEIQQHQRGVHQSETPAAVARQAEAARQASAARQAAASRGAAEAAEKTLLAAAGKKLLAADPEALLYAAKAGNVTKINQIVAAGGNLEVKDKWFGTTPLHMAANLGHEAAIKALVAAKADVHATDKASWGGQTPLHYAAACDQEAAIKALVASKADLHATTTPDGWMPLHTAAFSGKELAIRTLVAANHSRLQDTAF